MNKLIIGLGVTLVTASIAGAKKIYDKYHYGDDGFNSLGFDKDGYNREGYNKDGFNRNGYNKNGYNNNGYDKDGYDHRGLDRASCTRSDYLEKSDEISQRLKEAHSFMKKNDFESACFKIRKGLETGIKCIIWHDSGKEYVKSTLHKNILLCKKEYIINDDFYYELINAKNICNTMIHDNEEENKNEYSVEDITYNHIHFCYKTLENLIKIVRDIA